jgi:hypothetical protein
MSLADRLDVGLLFNFDEDYGYAGEGEQKRLDPWNTWSHDLASCDAKDPSLPSAVTKGVADSIFGPVEFYCMEGGSHQLMRFHTEAYSNFVQDSVLRQI